MTGYVAGAWVGIGLIVAAAAAVVFMQLASDASAIRRLWNKYVAYIDGELRFLMRTTGARRFAGIHAAAVGVHIALSAATGSPALWLFVPVTAIFPVWILARQRAARIRDIESLVNLWLLAVANALKSTPSIGEAIRSSMGLVRAPLSQELGLALKQMRLGVALDGALLAMGDRIGSPIFSSVITTLLVACRTGGELPSVLERSAATLREMERLEGVVRTKTAEGKSQAYVLAAVPFCLCGALHLIDPLWLPQLTQNMIGYLILAGSMSLWLGSVLIARKVLAVDI